MIATRAVAVSVILPLLNGCSYLQSEPYVYSNVSKTRTTGSTVCVVKNPQVKISDMDEAVRGNANDFGFRAISIEDEEMSTNDCNFVLLYSADRRWDIVFYLSMASFRLFKNGKQIARVDFRGSDGMVFDKYQNTKERILPPMKELFKNVVSSNTQPS